MEVELKVEVSGGGLRGGHDERCPGERRGIHQVERKVRLNPSNGREEKAWEEER